MRRSGGRRQVGGSEQCGRRRRARAADTGVGGCPQGGRGGRLEGMANRERRDVVRTRRDPVRRGAAEGRRDGYYWAPGNARHDRGYTLEEALVAVGPGWAPLVEEAWRAVTAVGGGVVQVKEKFGALRLYFIAPSEHSEQLARRIDALEEKSAEVYEGRQEWLEVERFQEWIPWQVHDQPDWWREAVSETLLWLTRAR
jgi:hypothetical protein